MRRYTILTIKPTEPPSVVEERLNALASQGWRLVEVVVVAGYVWYVLETE